MEIEWFTRFSEILKKELKFGFPKRDCSGYRPGGQGQWRMSVKPDYRKIGLLFLLFKKKSQNDKFRDFVFMKTLDLHIT